MSNLAWSHSSELFYLHDAYNSALGCPVLFKKSFFTILSEGLETYAV